MSARLRWSVFCVGFAVVEGVAIGLALRRPIVSMIGFCLILTATRLRLEVLLP